MYIFSLLSPRKSVICYVVGNNDDSRWYLCHSLVNEVQCSKSCSQVHDTRHSIYMFCVDMNAVGDSVMGMDILQLIAQAVCYTNISIMLIIYKSSV